MASESHLAIFCDDWSHRCRDNYSDLIIFKMAAVRHLGLLKVSNFTCQYGLEGQYASPCQISCQSVKPQLRYGHFSIFKNSGCPLSSIYYLTTWTTHEEHLMVFVIMQNLVGIGAVDVIVCKF